MPSIASRLPRLLERYPATFEPSPTYDLSMVTGLSTIQASNLALDENCPAHSVA